MFTERRKSSARSNFLSLPAATKDINQEKAKEFSKVLESNIRLFESATGSLDAESKHILIVLRVGPAALERMLQFVSDKRKGGRRRH